MAPGVIGSTPTSTMLALPSTRLVLEDRLLQPLQARQHVRHRRARQIQIVHTPQSGSCRRRNPSGTNRCSPRRGLAAISDRSGGCLPNQASASAWACAELMVEGLGRGEHQVAELRLGNLQVRRHAVVAQIFQRVAARAVVHEITRAALQGLDVVDVRAACGRAIPPPSSAMRTRPAKARSDQNPAFKHVP
jgi:hypothetical protein